MLPDPHPYFADLADPRRQTRNKLHKLQDIVMIVLCAVISGAEDWVGMLSIRQRKMYTGFNYEYRYQVIFGTKGYIARSPCK